MKEKDFFPIGTVVLLKNATKRVMITGYLVNLENDSKVYDYSGCMFPEGYLSADQLCLFNADQIDKIFHIGLEDNEQLEFNKKLQQLSEKVK